MKKGKVGLLLLFCTVLMFSGCGNQNMVQEIAEKNNASSESSTKNATPVSDSENTSEETSAEETFEADELAEDANNALGEEENTEESSENEGTSENDGGSKGKFIDLTKMSSTMVYSEVSNMMISPEEYVGKKIKMNGTFSVYDSEENGKRYFSCIIQDATACCASGIEFELKGKHKYPKDYPEDETEITVVGIFDTYKEDGFEYCILRKAKLL